MTINTASLEWAIGFTATHSDGDLFPKLLEMHAIQSKKSEVAAELAALDLSNYIIGSSRRFIVPKDEVSYRQATQLDPQDAIVLAAMLHQFGQGIEDRRASKDVVFSYRFAPSEEHGLYASQGGWNEFWSKAQTLAFRHEAILYCDIADFYNQVYHHTVENQLINSGFPNQILKWIIKLLESTTVGVSRGVPVGPHAVHLLAEATLIPIDNSLAAQGLNFIRYADDILVFCSDRKEAKAALNIIAQTLDQQQRLTLQRHKTKFLNSAECLAMCEDMVEDRPINNQENELLGMIRKYSGGNPYRTISFNSISSEDWGKLSEETISNIVMEYLSQDPIDYIRLRWFFRRLAQIGHPGGLRVVMNNIEALTPCMASICNYFASIETFTNEEWRNVGGELLTLVTSDEFKESEYFRLSLLSLFSRNSTLNHLSSLVQLYRSSDPFTRREIILAAAAGGGIDWLRELKESFQSMDEWQRRAFLYSSSMFPTDERKYFLGRFPQSRPFEKAICKWAKANSI